MSNKEDLDLLTRYGEVFGAAEQTGTPVPLQVFPAIIKEIRERIESLELRASREGGKEIAKLQRQISDLQDHITSEMNMLSLYNSGPTWEERVQEEKERNPQHLYWEKNMAILKRDWIENEKMKAEMVKRIKNYEREISRCKMQIKELTPNLEKVKALVQQYEDLLMQVIKKSITG
jgi:chaperonin cofactor prefoldin